MSSAEPALHRSYLYAPGSTPNIMRKALTAGADAVILDLEDAVAPGAKDTARNEVAALLTGAVARSVSPELHVRVNRDGDAWSRRDLEAVVSPALRAIRLPKAESARDVAAVAAVLDDLEQRRGLPLGQVQIYPTVESARGVVAVGEILTATPRVVRLAIGAADLLADLGASGDDELALLHVRSELVLRSRSAGVGPPIDSVHTNLHDEAGLLAAARHARSLGFVGKSVIHPRQLATVHEIFTPTDRELARAEQIVAAMSDAERHGHGTVVVDGHFVDAPIVARARALLALRSK